MADPRNAGRLPSRQENWIRNDILKALYAVQLQELSLKDVRAFWDAHPLDIRGRILRGAALARHIWRAPAKTPPWYFWSVLDSLEAFLLSRRAGYEPQTLAEKVSFAPGGGFPPPFGPAFPWRHLRSPMEGFDPHEARALAAELLPGLMREWFPGCLARLLQWRCRGRHAEAFFAFGPEERPSGRVPPFDPGFLLAKMLLRLPGLFGLPAFDEIRVLGDCRNYSQLGWSDDLGIRGQALYRGKSRYGRVEPFSTFARSEELDPGLELPDRLVVVLERDFVCPVRRRVVLGSGGACGAPVYLFSLGFTTGASPGKFPPPGGTERRRAFWSGALDRHRRFLAGQE